MSSLSGLNTKFVHYPVSADSPEYPNELGEFDIVCSFGLIYHLTDHRQNLLNIRRMTRHAIVLFSSYYRTFPTEIVEDPNIRYASVTGRATMPTRSSIIGGLIDAGFRQVFEMHYHPSMDKDSEFLRSTTYLVAFV